MELMSAWGPLIYAGCFAATLSSAIASLGGAPRVLQALAKDKLYPGIFMFSKGTGANNDPVRGYILVFVISFVCIMIGGFVCLCITTIIIYIKKNKNGNWYPDSV